MIPDKSITEIETVVKGIFEKSRKRSFLCAAFCATERGKTNRQTWGANRQTRGTQAEKDSRPNTGGCFAGLTLYHRSAPYNTSKEKTENVSAPQVASGTKRTPGAVQVAFVGGGVSPHIGKAGRDRPCARLLDAEGGGAV